MVVERFVSQSPKDLLIASVCVLLTFVFVVRNYSQTKKDLKKKKNKKKKNYEFVVRLQKRMKERGAYQGKKYRDSEKRIIFAGDKFATE